MKTFAQILGLIIILAAGFWVGMRWGSMESAPVVPLQPTQNVSPTRPVTQEPQPTPITEAPAVTEPEPATTPTPTTPAVETPIATTPSSTPSTVDLPISKNDKVNRYENTNFGYGFDIPANLYYSGFGAANEAKHTVGISKEVPETLDASAVRVYFYGKKILPELQGVSTYVDPAGKYLLVLVGGQYSVRIEANDVTNPIVQKIAQTLTVQ